mmetsp:Transcript_14326/g.16657  ORF Transcript_14326/g.16657 Transcript_14326/m.16657 type:complete len:97 (+) Transcript_14326:58-348(+)
MMKIWAILALLTAVAIENRQNTQIGNLQYSIQSMLHQMALPEMNCEMKVADVESDFDAGFTRRMDRMNNDNDATFYDSNNRRTGIITAVGSIAVSL